MCFQKQELITLSEARAKLEEEGLRPGTEEYRRESHRFVDAEMVDDETNEALFYEVDHTQVGKQHGEKTAEQAAAGAM